jgi:hypothetical protein
MSSSAMPQPMASTTISPKNPQCSGPDLSPDLNRGRRSAFGRFAQYQLFIYKRAVRDDEIRAAVTEVGTSTSTSRLQLLENLLDQRSIRHVSLDPGRR